MHLSSYYIEYKKKLNFEKSHLFRPITPGWFYDKVYAFIYEIIKHRKKLNIIDDLYNLNSINNVDETPIFLEIVSEKTSDLERSKMLLSSIPVILAIMLVWINCHMF